MISETTVAHMLNAKPSLQVWSIAPDETVFAALRKMAVHNVGALLVMQDEEIAGIITERDYARKVVLQNRSSRETLVSEIMSSKVLYALPSDTAEGCMALMTEKRIRHLPVLEDGRLAGLISMGDVVKAVIDDQGFTIDQLARYITGSYSGAHNPLEWSGPSIEERLV